MHNLKIALTGALVFISCFTRTAAAQTFFANTYGGTGYDYAYSLVQTADGGYVFCGPGTMGAGGINFWVVKLDASGDITWQNVYGGASDDYALSIRQTSDGGYILTGRTASYGAGGFDFWVLKLTSAGAVTWQRTYGGTGDDMAYSVREAMGGGYFVTGWTNSYGAGSYDFWVLKLDASGGIVWQKVIGGANIDTVYSSVATADGGVVVAGGTLSFGAGGYDVWILKLDASGGIVWQKAIGGTKDDIAFSIDSTADGGVIAAGFTLSYGAGSNDIWVLKLDASGAITWQRTYGGSALDWAFAVRQTGDGGYLVGARTTSFGAGVEDVLVLKLDASGTVTWQRTYGGGALDYAYTVWQAGDGSYLVGGVTGSFGSGSYDAVVLKLDPSCMSGAACSPFNTPSVAVSAPSPSIQTTTRSPASTSCSTSTPVYTASASSAVKTSQCAYAVPGSAMDTLTVTKSGGAPLLRWQAPGGTCVVTGYGIYRGTFPVHPYNHQSLDCTVTVLNYTDGTAGDDHYYLVVPFNAYTEGSYGTGFDGSVFMERPAGSSPCKPHCLLSCP